MKYDTIITNLESIIENWYDKAELVKHITSPHDGLCDNIKPFGSSININSISSWMYFDGDYMFPVHGLSEYDRALHDPYILFTNPKRLHLAVHMLQWFRQHNA